MDLKRQAPSSKRLKEDSKGNKKFYEYDGDHSWMADGLDGVENDQLIEQKE